MTCTIIVARYKPAGNEAGKYKKNVFEGHFDALACDTRADSYAHHEQVKDWHHFEEHPPPFNFNEENIYHNDAQQQHNCCHGDGHSEPSEHPLPHHEPMTFDMSHEAAGGASNHRASFGHVVHKPTNHISHPVHSVPVHNHGSGRDKVKVEPIKSHFANELTNQMDGIDDPLKLFRNDYLLNEGKRKQSEIGEMIKHVFVSQKKHQQGHYKSFTKDPKSPSEVESLTGFTRAYDETLNPMKSKLTKQSVGKKIKETQISHRSSQGRATTSSHFQDDQNMPDGAYDLNPPSMPTDPALKNANMLANQAAKFALVLEKQGVDTMAASVSEMERPPALSVSDTELLSSTAKIGRIQPPASSAITSNMYHHSSNGKLNKLLSFENLESPSVRVSHKPMVANRESSSAKSVKLINSFENLDTKASNLHGTMTFSKDQKPIDSVSTLLAQDRESKSTDFADGFRFVKNGGNSERNGDEQKVIVSKAGKTVQQQQNRDEKLQEKEKSFSDEFSISGGNNNADDNEKISRFDKDLSKDNDKIGKLKKGEKDEESENTGSKFKHEEKQDHKLMKGDREEGSKETEGSNNNSNLKYDDVDNDNKDTLEQDIKKFGENKQQKQQEDEESNRKVSGFKEEVGGGKADSGTTVQVDEVKSEKTNDHMENSGKHEKFKEQDEENVIEKNHKSKEKDGDEPDQKNHKLKENENENDSDPKHQRFKEMKDADKEKGSGDQKHQKFKEQEGEEDVKVKGTGGQVSLLKALAAEKQEKENKNSDGEPGKSSKGKEEDERFQQNSKEDEDEKLYTGKNGSSKNSEDEEGGNKSSEKNVQSAQEEKLKESEEGIKPYTKKPPVMLNGEPLTPSKEKHVSGVSLEDRLPPKFQKILEAGGKAPPQSLAGKPVKPANPQQKPTEATLVKEGTDSEGNNYVHYTDKPTGGKPISSGLPESVSLQGSKEVSDLNLPLAADSIHPKPHLSRPEAISPSQQNKLLPPETIGPIQPGKPYIPPDELPGNDGPMVSSNPLEAVGLPIAETPHAFSNNTVVEASEGGPRLTGAPHPMSNDIVESSGLGVESSFRFASFGSPVILHIGATGFDEGKKCFFNFRGLSFTRTYFFIIFAN